MVAQLIECQIASIVVPDSNPSILKLRLVALSLNTASGGQDYLNVDGATGLLSFLEGWFWSRTKVNGEKKAPSWS
jgi:hypothetical protein